jgi:hypothetical protein
MINDIFYLCVDILAWLAKATGTTYELINILIFIIGYPLFVMTLLGVIYWQYKNIKKLKCIKSN